MVRISALIVFPSIAAAVGQRHITFDFEGRQVILDVAEGTACQGSQSYLFDPVTQEGACCEAGEEFSNGVCQPATMHSPFYMPADTCSGGCGCPACPACPSFPAIPACPACPSPGSCCPGNSTCPPVVPPVKPSCPAIDQQTYTSNNVTFKVFCDKSLGGADLTPPFPVKDLQGCIDSCAARAQCQGHDYYQGVCYLKSSYLTSPSIALAGCVSIVPLPMR